MKFFRTVFILTIVLLLDSGSNIDAVEIRQDRCTWGAPLTKQIEIDTFVIDKKASNSSFSSLTKIHTTFFTIGSDLIDSKRKEEILTALSNNFTGKRSKLWVVGHACALGNKDKNYLLSLRRAKRVYEFLSEKGFTVKAIEGKGIDEPLTNKRDKFYLNRRVEIFLLEDNTSS